MIQEFRIRTQLPPPHIIKMSPESINDSIRRDARVHMAHSLDKEGYITYNEVSNMYGEVLQSSLVVATQDDMIALKHCQDLLGGLQYQDIPEHIMFTITQVYQNIVKVVNGR